jgi:antitoxin FitA
VAQLLVRGLEETIVAALKKRAARHGLSVEAEHRAILRAALAPGSEAATLKQQLAAMPPVGRDDEFARPRASARRRSR